MGFLNSIQALAGTGSQVSIEDVKKEWGSLLAKDEEMKVAFKTFRDYFIFTTKRLIFINAQGITGKKIMIQTLPYDKIMAFGVETAGVMDFNAELYIWMAGNVGGEPKIGENVVHAKFNKDCNIYEVQAVLADAVAGSRE